MLIFAIILAVCTILLVAFEGASLYAKRGRCIFRALANILSVINVLGAIAIVVIVLMNAQMCLVA